MILASTVFGMRTVRHISEAMEIVCNAPCLWQENVEPKTKQLTYKDRVIRCRDWLVAIKVSRQKLMS